MNKWLVLLCVCALTSCSKAESEEDIPVAVGQDKKDSYANYLHTGLVAKTTLVQPFDAKTAQGWQFATQNAAAMEETTIKKEGRASLMVATLASGTTTAVEAQGLAISVDHKRQHFLRMWVYINDIRLLDSDKSGSAYADQGTLYIQTGDGKQVHQWNHTLSGSGWHALELSFANHNSKQESIDALEYRTLSTFKVFYQGKPGLKVGFDQLEWVKYSSSSASNPAPDGGRLLSNCDANELGGVVLGEWYGASFDLNNKKEGLSSLRVEGNAKHNEYRAYIGGFSEEIDEQEDELCFWLYVEDLQKMGTQGWVIELNEEQDLYEYECGFDVAARESGGIQNGWNFIRIPIAAMRKTGSRPGKMKAHAFRMAVPGTQVSASYRFGLDQIYLRKKQQ